MKQPRQLFFRPDEDVKAAEEAKRTGLALLSIVDCRSHCPKPLMYVVGCGTVDQMRAHKMFKRMWTIGEVH